jgi:hypothetical protein
MQKKKVKLLVGICLVLFLPFMFLPSISLALDGQTIVQGKCTACHSDDRIKSSRKTASEWASQVDKEIGRGAQLNSEEREAVIDYLASTYGTSQSSAESASANSASSETNSQQSNTLSQSNSSSTATDPANITEQAYTGIELWQVILAGSSLIGSGVALRRRKK